MSEENPRGTVALLLIIVAVGWFVIHRLSARPEPKSVEFLFCYDTSGSNNERLKKFDYGVTDMLVDEVLPPGSRVSVWAFDAAAQKLFSGTPEQARDLWRLQDQMLRANSRTWGTFPATVLRQVLQYISSSAVDKKFAIVLFWDGEDFDAAATHKLVCSLSSHVALSAVLIVGVASQERHRVEKDFSPLCSRLTVSSDIDAQWAIQDFRKRILSSEENHNE